ncbi:MAG: PPE family protein [Mycobacterium sp.]|nr:MAG: PPE family protein [Mycobacterium sp.]
MDFLVSPPEVTSARIARGPGSLPLLAAAAAWEGLGEDLASTADAFTSVVSNLAESAWQGTSATAMAELAFSYACWLRDAATGAAQAAHQATAAAASYDTALTATVPLEILAGNRTQLLSLVASNILGFNAPAIAATEAAYEQMWAQDVAAMADYYAGAVAAAAALTPWQTLIQPSGAAPAVSATSAASALSATSTASAAASNVTLVIGGSGFPLPSQSYVNTVMANYVTPNFPAFTVTNAQALLTPAQSYWITGIKTLTEEASWAQGLTILDSAIHTQLAAGNTVVVQGFSQGAGIASLEMANLKAAGVPSDAVSFSLVGNPMNPNGGLYSRFDGLTLPSLGKMFPGSTPANDYPTVVYTIEYDGFADFPRYPLNFVADANAMLGALYVHPLYPTLTPAQVATAVELPTEGPTMTKYYMIPTHNLPLLEPLRTSFLGNTIADLIQPDLKVIVNLGYGDPDYGYSTSPANVPTPFGLFPNVSPVTVFNDLVTGTQQGISAASADLSTWHPPSLPSVSASGVRHLSLPALQPLSVDGFIQGLQTANTKITTAATSAVASAYSTLLPTADTLTAIAVSLPSYDVNLFLDGITQAVAGDPAGLINAVGYPLAADTGLLTFLSFFLAYAYYGAAKSIVSDVAGIL